MPHVCGGWDKECRKSWRGMVNFVPGSNGQGYFLSGFQIFALGEKCLAQRSSIFPYSRCDKYQRSTSRGWWKKLGKNDDGHASFLQVKKFWAPSAIQVTVSPLGQDQSMFSSLTSLKNISPTLSASRAIVLATFKRQEPHVSTHSWRNLTTEEALPLLKRTSFTPTLPGTTQASRLWADWRVWGSPCAGSPL